MSFPTTPTNGQRSVINGITYQYSSATNSWKRSPTTTVTTSAGATPPTNPAAGQQWYNTANDKLYFYINDGTSNYWVDMSGIIFNVSSSSGGTTDAKSVGYSMVFGG